MDKVLSLFEEEKNERRVTQAIKGEEGNWRKEARF